MRKSKNAGKTGRNPVTGKIFSILERQGPRFKLISTWQTRIGAEQHKAEGQLIFSESALMKRITNWELDRNETQLYLSKLKEDVRNLKSQLAAATKAKDLTAELAIQSSLDRVNSEVAKLSGKQTPDLDSLRDIATQLRKL